MFEAINAYFELGNFYNEDKNQIYEVIVIPFENLFIKNTQNINSINYQAY